MYQAMDVNMLIAAAILVGSYALIFSGDSPHQRGHPGCGDDGRVGMLLGYTRRRHSWRRRQHDSAAHLDDVDGRNAAPDRRFRVPRSRLRDFRPNDPRRLLVYLSLAVSLISMVLDNVTTLIVFAP